MNIWGLLKNILPFVTPYRWLIVITLVLTLVGSLMAQVNAVVLDRAVDAINALIQTPGGFPVGASAVQHPDGHQHHPAGQGGGGRRGHLLPALLRRADAHPRQPRPVAEGGRPHPVVPHGILYRRGQRDGQAAVAHRPRHHEPVEHGQQLLHRDPAALHQCRPGPAADVSWPTSMWDWWRCASCPSTSG